MTFDYKNLPVQYNSGVVTGRKGGSSSAQAEQHIPVEDPNSLQSKAMVRIMDAVACGEIKGLVNGAKSIYLDETPLQNPDGTFNFQGVTYDFRTGTPNQSYMPGFPAVESEVSVGVDVKAGPNKKVARRIDNLNANAVRVTITAQSMFSQDTKTGDTHGSEVSFIIRLARIGGAWTTYNFTITGKNMGPYQQSYRLPLPTTNGPWDMEVERVTPDSNVSTVQNSIQLSSYTEIVDYKLRYPNIAYSGVIFDGALFGSQIASRAYEIDGWICRVPDNFDPIQRTYSGIWGGNFKRAWTDDPAWLFYQLLTHPAGAGLPDSSVDKWALYGISQYCNQTVPDGYGGSELRFTANFCINTRQEAYAVINAMASAFRAMTYWSSGAVTLSQDVPQDPAIIVTPSNTIGGFDYGTPALNARHTVAIVSFVDKNDGYRVATEVYEDSEAIDRYGWNPTEVTAFACTSRGQAHRLGKWIVDSEAHEERTLTYKCSLDHLKYGPGSVIAVADPDYAGARMGGRILATVPNAIQVDSPVNIEAGKTYQLMATMPDGSVQKRNLATAVGVQNFLTVSPAFTQSPQLGGQWLLLSSSLAPQQFRILSITEEDSLTFTVQALQFDPTKFARVEQGYNFSLPPFSRLPNPGVTSPPSNVSVSRQYVQTPTGWIDALQITWDASGDPFVRGYVVRYRKNSGTWVSMPESPTTTTTIYGEGAGRYNFQVQAANFAGVLSVPATLDVNISDQSPITLLRPTGLELEGQGNDTIFKGPDPKFTWRATAVHGAYDAGQEPAAGAGWLDNVFRDFEIRVIAPNGQTVFTDHTTLTWYTFTLEKNAQTKGGPYRLFTFQVFMRDRWGNLSLPAELTVNNPAPDLPNNLSIQSGIGSIFLSFDRPTDRDFAGTLVWVGAETGFTPGANNLAYDGTDTFLFLNASANTERYIRLAAYDLFGKTGLNVTGEYHIHVSGVVEPDLVPPSAPTGLALYQWFNTSDDGVVSYNLQATWDAVTADDLSYYSVTIRDTNELVGVETSAGQQTLHSWTVDAGFSYAVKVRAVDKAGNSSIFSGEVTALIVGDNIPPATPDYLKWTNAFRTVWLEWLKPEDKDYLWMQVWASETNNRDTATLVGRATGTQFAHEGLAGGETWYYWIKAEDRSHNVSDWFPSDQFGGVEVTTRKIETADYQNLSIVNAAIADAQIDDAKISSLSASKILAGSVISGSVLVDGTHSLGSVANASGDPASAINAGSTRIDPGKIVVAGNSTLADWRMGPNDAAINGGMISVNTIRSNSMVVGLRNISTLGIQFETHKENNTISWTSGWVVVASGVPGSNGAVSEQIAAGSAAWPGNTIWIVWKPGDGKLNVTTDGNIVGNPDWVVAGTYWGGPYLWIDWGQAIIDGTTIRARTVNADRIQANSISANELSTGRLLTNTAQIADGLINSAHIGNAQIHTAHINDLDASKITAGTISASSSIMARNTAHGSGYVQMDGNANRFICHDGVRPRALMGLNVGQNDYGLQVWSGNGTLVFDVNGLGVNIVGEVNINGSAVSSRTIAGSAVTSTDAISGGSGSQITFTTQGYPIFVYFCAWGRQLISYTGDAIQTIAGWSADCVVDGGVAHTLGTGSAGTSSWSIRYQYGAGTTHTFRVNAAGTTSLFDGCTILVLECKR